MISVLQTLGAGAMMITCFCLVAQAVIVRGRYGWKYRPWWSRGLMVVVTGFLLPRALTVLHGGVLLNPLGIGLAFSMATWQFSELLRVVTDSWRQRADLLELGRHVDQSVGAPMPWYQRYVRRD